MLSLPTVRVYSSRSEGYSDDTPMGIIVIWELGRNFWCVVTIPETVSSDYAVTLHFGPLPDSVALLPLLSESKLSILEDDYTKKYTKLARTYAKQSLRAATTLFSPV